MLYLTAATDHQFCSFIQFFCFAWNVHQKKALNEKGNDDNAVLWLLWNFATAGTKRKWTFNYNNRPLKIEHNRCIFFDKIKNFRYYFVSNLSIRMYNSNSIDWVWYGRHKGKKNHFELPSFIDSHSSSFFKTLQIEHSIHYKDSYFAWIRNKSFDVHSAHLYVVSSICINIYSDSSSKRYLHSNA